MYESSYLVFLLQTLVALVQTVEDLLKHLLLLVHLPERLVDLRLELTNRRHDDIINDSAATQKKMKRIGRGGFECCL